MRPCLIKLLYNVFKAFGSEPFRKASRQSFYSTRMSFYANRLSRHPTKYQDEQSFTYLWRKYEIIYAGSKTRYDLLLPNAWEIYDNFSNMGCKFLGCLDRSQIKQLMLAHEENGDLNNEEIGQKLDRWRRKLKICAR